LKLPLFLTLGESAAMFDDFFLICIQTDITEDTRHQMAVESFKLCRDLGI